MEKYFGSAGDVHCCEVKPYQYQISYCPNWKRMRTVNRAVTSLYIYMKNCYKHSIKVYYSVFNRRPAVETDRVISNEELYLCDSGAQFK